ncbi:hypothetical protein B0H98_10770 [Vreelandella songnenensis]|uniref:Uncharacterized protein n=1 Tax=Vreelandella songnenensis TaxID=1176243 RepID=A0A2T0V165_9GAMM|nr:hypothetical protein [Halomonas songnenensis]PRY63925.1 hypothetical protein B0H98_10770 [Halomonas songnenensis]
MKKSTLIAAIALTLTSTAALAEQGSGELNEIVHASSTAGYSTDELYMTPADLPLVNGDAAKNRVIEPSSEAHHGSHDEIVQSDLPHRNAS